MVAPNTAVVKTPGFILLIVAFVLNFIGAIMVWQEKGMGDSTDYVAALGGPLLPLFMMAAVMVAEFSRLKWFGVSLALFLLNTFVALADVFGETPGSSKDDVLAGLSMLIIGTLLCLIGLTPVEKAGAIPNAVKAALGDIPKLVIVIGAFFCFIGACCCWGYADEAKGGGSDFAGAGVFALATTGVVIAAAFTDNEAAVGVSLAMCAYGFITFMILALNDNPFKEDLRKAGAVLLWIAFTLYWLALAVLPGLLGGGGGKAKTAPSNSTPKKSGNK